MKLIVAALLSASLVMGAIFVLGAVMGFLILHWKVGLAFLGAVILMGSLNKT